MLFITRVKLALKDQEDKKVYKDRKDLAESREGMAQSVRPVPLAQLVLKACR